MYLLALFFLQNVKKFLESIQKYEDVPFSGPKRPICSEQNFLVQTIIITFIYLLAFFIVQNLKKILIVDPELWRCGISGSKLIHLPC